MERVRPPLPPRQRRAFSTFDGPVRRAGAPAEAAVLEGLFRLDQSITRALTHGFHSYAGRMHPTIARGAIARWSSPGGRVLDPFCGSGTVLVEALVAGRAARGIDASPLATRLAAVRTTPLGEAGRARLVEAANEISEEAGIRARKRQRPEIPEWAGGEFKRFHAHVAYELLGLRELIVETPEDEIGWALRMCLSSLLVKFMRAGPEAPRDGEGKRIARGLPSRFFAGRADELARGLAELERVTPPGTPAPVITLGDARTYPDVPNGRAHLVVTSPPYAGTYDYAQQHEVRFRWLGLPQGTFRSRQLGERERGPGAVPEEWRRGRKLWLGEIARVLEPGGHAVLVVGDGIVGDEPEDAAGAVAAQGQELGLRLVAQASQERSAMDRRVRELFRGQPREEHIILLRKG
jgi:SAM-dependent methyltransferase